VPEILIIETYEKSIKMKQENLQFEGIVTQELGNSMFKVKLNVSSESDEVLCTISGKIRKNYIKILTGDGVKIEMTPYDLTRGRIV
jgi:translation initiation factor IF-1